MVLKRWLEHHFSDFDGELFENFTEFVTESKNDKDVELLKKVLELAEKKVCTIPYSAY